MHRWLYFVVACSAAVGVACGGDSSKKDAAAADARPAADASALADARPDAGAPDAAAPDARPDAGSTPDAAAPDAPGPTIDAAPQPDAVNNCPGGSDPGCTAAGTSCVDGDTEQVCEQTAPGCFKQVSGSAATCTSNKSCTAGAGCVCDAQPKCDGPGDGAGSYCGTADDSAANAQSAYTCADVASDDDECIVPVDAEDCAAPSICSEATPGAAICVCPAAGNLPNDGCGNQVGVETCSSDNGSVLRCEVQNAGGLNCNVWTLRDDCGSEGLVCEDAACVCPDTGNEKEFFANPVVDRSARPDLLPTGVRFPPVCSLPLISQAVTLATAESLGGFFPVYAVASDDGAPEGTTEVVFDEEPLPIVVGDFVTLTTLDHPRFAGDGSNIRNTYWKIKANMFSTSAPDGANGFIWLRGRNDSVSPDHPGGSMIGFEVDVEPCRFAAAKPGAVNNCEYPDSVVYVTGNSANLGGALGRPNMHRNFINGSGSGAPALAQDAVTGFPAFGGILAGGQIRVEDDGTFTYEAAGEPDPNDPRFDGGFFAPLETPNCEGNFSRVLAITGAANPGNNGVFTYVSGVDEDTIALGGPGAANEILPASATVTLICLSGTNFARHGLLVANGNGVFEDTVYAGFLSESRSFRAGARVTGVFDSRGVVFSGGLWSANDIGLFVDDDDDDSVVTVGRSPFAVTPATFAGNLDQGILISKTDCSQDGVVFSGSEMLVQSTFRQTGANPFGMGEGHGIVIDGLPVVEIADSTISGNAQDGVLVPTSVSDAKPGTCTENPGSLLLQSSTLADNGVNGLQVNDFYGTIEVLGGAITGNGTDLGVQDYDPNAPVDSHVYAVGNGIRIDGCISGPDFFGDCLGGFFTNQDADSGRLQVTGNTLAGLRATESALYITATDFTGNATANKCITGRTTADARDATVILSGRALGHLSDVKVNTNFGTGVRISSNAGGDRPNTISASQVNGNLNLVGCAFDPREPSFTGPPFFSGGQGNEEESVANVSVSAAIHVRRGGHLQVTDGTTEVDSNAKHGIYNSGRIDTFTARSTELDPNDPAAEVDGAWSIDSNGWNGFFVSSFSNLVEIQGGNLSGNGTDPTVGAPNDGFAMVGTQDIFNSVTVTGTLIQDNAGHGASINTRDHSCTVSTRSADLVRFNSVTVTGNGGSGFSVTGAPGNSRSASDPGNSQCQFLTDVPLTMEVDDYGFQVADSTITGNGGDGVTLGAPLAPGLAATGQVLAMIGGSESSNDISTNGGSGVKMQGGAGVGGTVAGNLIHDNGDSGFTLGSSVVVPLFVENSLNHGLGFISNEVNHNAMAGGGCTGTQDLAQIYITGPTAIPQGVCAGPSEENACNALNTVNNQHCLWTGTNCVRSHDLKGDIVGTCSNGLLNSVYDYNINDTGSFDSVGARAISNSVVDMNNNEWRSSTITQNVTMAPGSFIRANVLCGGRNMCFTP